MERKYQDLPQLERAELIEREIRDMISLKSSQALPKKTSKPKKSMMPVEYYRTDQYKDAIKERKETNRKSGLRSLYVRFSQGGGVNKR